MRMASSFALLGLKKLADGSEAAAVLPQIKVPSTAPPEDKTLPGMVPPVAYTQVNASMPPVPDAGAMAQKSMAPMGAQSLPKTAQQSPREEIMAQHNRTLVHDLLKEAQNNAARRATIAAEGARQMNKTAAEKCAKCSKEPCECKKKEAQVDMLLESGAVEKLAQAVEYIGMQFAEEAKEAAHGGAALPHGVTASHQTGSPPGPGQQGQGRHQNPMHPGTQKARPSDSSTQAQNDKDKRPGGTGEQTTALSGGKGKAAAEMPQLTAAGGDPGFNLTGNIKPTLTGAARIAAMTGAAGGLSGALDAAGDEDASNEAILRSGAGGAAGGALGGAAGYGLGAHLGGMAGEALTKKYLGDRMGDLGQVGGAAMGALGGAAVGGLGGHLLGKNLATRGMQGQAAAEQEGAEKGASATFRRNVDFIRKEASRALGLTDTVDIENKAEALLALKKQAATAGGYGETVAGPQGNGNPPDVNKAGEPGGEPVGGVPQGPRSLVASNQAAINYDKGQSHGVRRQELQSYFSEPALTSSTDKTLGETFAHTGVAGTKLSSDATTKVAAARALMMNLADAAKKGSK